jgi:hypothetical protein
MKYGLVQGRHEIPNIDGYVFSEIPNEKIFDYEYMESQALDRIQGLKKLDLYVTGLTSALVIVLEICQKHDISLTLWHYDVSTGGYIPQIIRPIRCSKCGCWA